MKDRVRYEYDIYSSGGRLLYRCSPTGKCEPTKDGIFYREHGYLPDIIAIEPDITPGMWLTKGSIVRGYGQTKVVDWNRVDKAVEAFYTLSPETKGVLLGLEVGGRGNKVENSILALLAGGLLLDVARSKNNLKIAEAAKKLFVISKGEVYYVSTFFEMRLVGLSAELGIMQVEMEFDGKCPRFADLRREIDDWINKSLRVNLNFARIEESRTLSAMLTEANKMSAYCKRRNEDCLR